MLRTASFSLARYGGVGDSGWSSCLRFAVFGVLGPIMRKHVHTRRDVEM